MMKYIRKGWEWTIRKGNQIDKKVDCKIESKLIQPSLLFYYTLLTVLKFISMRFIGAWILKRYQCFFFILFFLLSSVILPQWHCSHTLGKLLFLMWWSNSNNKIRMERTTFDGAVQNHVRLKTIILTQKNVYHTSSSGGRAWFLYFFSRLPFFMENSFWMRIVASQATFINRHCFGLNLIL